MTLTLISLALCPYAQRAAIMLREKRVPFSVKLIEPGREPDFLAAISPRGKVPVLVADGAPIFESSAILEFVDETHPPRLLPDDPVARARERAWLQAANDLFDAQYHLFTARDQQTYLEWRDASRALLARFETEMRGRHFSGHTFGFVDIAIAPALVRFRLAERITGNGIMDDLPAVTRWTERLAHRPSVVESAPFNMDALFVNWLRDSFGFRQGTVAA